MAAMGYDAEAFAGAMTSGHVAEAFLTSTLETVPEKACFLKLREILDAIAGEGRRARVAHATWSMRGNVQLGEAFGEAYQVVSIERPEDVDACDFVLAHGVEAFGRGDGEKELSVSDETMRLMIERAAEKKKPLVVANPDVVTVSGDELVMMPGTLATYYRDSFKHAHRGESGDEYVCLMGKPDGIVYDALLGEIGRSKAVDSRRVLAVGDSLAHDVAGANDAGIDALFVCDTGIHAQDMRHARARSDDAVDALFDAHGAHPALVISRLEW